MHRMESLRARLLGPAPAALARQRRVAVLGVLLLTVVGGALRLWRLGYPSRLVFDETYYVKQAWSLVRYGYESEIRKGLEDPDALWVAGDPEVFDGRADMVVHPPVGKWMISIGELLMGPQDPMGWRLSSAVVGTLSIALIGWCAWLIWKNALPCLLRWHRRPRPLNDICVRSAAVPSTLFAPIAVTSMRC